LGLGGGTFPLLLTMLGLRARTDAGTAALSGFVQSVGYLIAALGPLMVGLLYDATGTWRGAEIFLLVTLSVQTAAGLFVGRSRHVEDEEQGRLVFFQRRRADVAPQRLA
jgi:CP family cyanate transporter-like MFS transporter